MPLSDLPAWPPGWHGKLPSLGDFAQRRMDADFLGIWDTWLAEGLLAMREQQPQGWLESYLASPSWRFVVAPGAMPGAAGTRAWAGVLMPSVDRVGRYFPFSLVWALPALPASTEAQRALWACLGRLDDLAADALDEDWTVEQLEDALARLPQPPVADAGPAAELPGPPATTGTWRTEALTAGPDIAGHFARQAQALWRTQVQGLAWWLARTGDLSPGLRTSRGLPATAGLLLGATMPAASASAPPP
jgi:type VI secretion system protein ImpM